MPPSHPERVFVCYCSPLAWKLPPGWGVMLAKHHSCGPAPGGGAVLPPGLKGARKLTLSSF